MTVEILNTDSPEDVEKKMQALFDARKTRDAEKKERIKSFSGVLTRADIDPIQIQKKLRDEWD